MSRARSFAGRALRKLRHIRSRRELEPLAQIIAAFARARPDAFVIQIGSHDSSQLDPLRPYILDGDWRGILVEPVPAVFERLRANYEGVSGLTFENVAISDRNGTMDLHYIPQTDETGLPEWYDALASVKKDVLLTHERFIPDIKQRMRTMQVPCLTFDALCGKHGVERIDFVQIDTEGYDFEIVKMIDLDRYQPALLQYEELHLDEATRNECLAHLKEHGFEAVGNTMDCLCLHPDRVADAAVTRAWRKVHDGSEAHFRA